MTQSTFQEIIDNSRRWEQDAVLRERRSRRVAWVIAGVASACFALSAIALASLAPLKQIEPFLVRVDNSTGIIDTVASFNNAPETVGEATKRYFIAQYVRAYENYSAPELQANFKVVSTMSAGPVQEEYARWIGAGNPTSPQALYGTHSTATIEIKGVQLIGDNVATVRYYKTVRAAKDMNSVSVTHWIATINFRLLEKNELSVAQLLINPIAFVVTGYRNDPEVAPK